VIHIANHRRALGFGFDVSLIDVFGFDFDFVFLDAIENRIDINFIS
jgi:hypothetical protein